MPLPNDIDIQDEHTNVHKSTGPRTPEGKNRVALSTFRHGVSVPDFSPSATRRTPSRLWKALEGKGWWQRPLVSPHRRQDADSSGQVVVQKAEMQEQSRH